MTTQWTKEGANLLHATLNKLGFPPLSELSKEERAEAISQVKDFFREAEISRLMPGGGSKEPFSTAEANKAREKLGLGKWVPLDLIVSDSRHRLIRDDDNQREGDVDTHISSGFDLNLMWQRNRSEARNGLARIDTDINNQSSFLYRSISELFSNAVDASNPSRFKIGRFGVGFYQIFQHLRTESDFITVETSREQDDKVTRLIFKKGKETVEVSLQILNKEDSPIDHGTRITIEAAHLEAKKAFQFSKQALKWNTDAKIIINRHAVNKDSIEQLQSEADSDLPVVRGTLKDGMFVIQDEGCGMSGDDLLHRLLVPKLGSKSSVSDLVHEQPESAKIKIMHGDLRQHQEGSTILLVGGVSVSDFKVSGVNVPQATVIDLPHSTKLTEERDGIFPDAEVERLYMQLIDDAVEHSLIEAGAILNGLAPVIKDFDARSTHRTEPDFLTRYARQKVIDKFPQSAFLPNSENIGNIGLDYGSFIPINSNLVRSRLSGVEGLKTNPKAEYYCNAPAFGFAPFLDQETLYVVDAERKTIIMDERIISNIGDKADVLAYPLNSIKTSGNWIDVVHKDQEQSERAPQYDTLEALLNAQGGKLGFNTISTAGQGQLLHKAAEYPQITDVFLKKVWPNLYGHQMFDGITLLEDALWACDGSISEEESSAILSVIGDNLERFATSPQVSDELSRNHPNIFEIWETQNVTDSYKDDRELYVCEGKNGKFYHGYVEEYVDRETRTHVQKIVLRSLDDESIEIKRPRSSDYIFSFAARKKGEDFWTITTPSQKYKMQYQYWRSEEYDFKSSSREELEKLYRPIREGLREASNRLTPQQIAKGDLVIAAMPRTDRDVSDHYSARALSNVKHSSHSVISPSNLIVDLGDRVMLNLAPGRSNKAALSVRLFNKLKAIEGIKPLSDEKISTIDDYIRYHPELSTAEIGTLLYNAQSMSWLRDQTFSDLLPAMSLENDADIFPLPSGVIEQIERLESPSQDFRRYVILSYIKAADPYVKDSEPFMLKFVDFINSAEKYLPPSQLRSFLKSIHGYGGGFFKSLVRHLADDTFDEKTAQKFLNYSWGLSQIFYRTLLNDDRKVASIPRRDPERSVIDRHSAELDLTQLIAWAQSHSDITRNLGSVDAKLELPELQQAVELFAVGKDFNIVSREVSHAVESTTNEPYRFAVELISNALDADTSIVPEDEAVNISVRGRAMEGEHVCLSVTDNKGMTLSEVVRYLLIPGQSSKGSNKDEIGFFGQGFYTALQHADKLVIQTKKGEEGQGLQIVIEPERQGGVVTNAAVTIAPIKTKKIGTTIHWVGNHSSPSFWTSQVGAEISSHFRYLEPEKAIVKFNGKRSRVKRKLIAMDRVEDIGEIKVWSTEELRDILTVKNMPVTNFHDFTRGEIPEFMLGSTEYFFGTSLQCDLPPGVRLTRSRKGLAAGQAENVDLKPIVTKMVVDGFMKRLQKLPAREVANLFPFDYLPRTYFTDQSSFDPDEQHLIETDAKALMNGQSIEDIHKYEEPEMIARLMSFMPVFAIKSKRYSLEQLKEHYRDGSGPFEDSFWLFKDYVPGTSEAIRNYLYNVNVAERIRQFDIENPYLWNALDPFLSGSGGGSGKGYVSIGGSTLDDLMDTCRDKKFYRMLDYRRDLELLERNTNLLLRGVFGLDEAKDWKVLFEAHNRSWSHSAVKIASYGKAVVWNAGRLFRDKGEIKAFEQACRYFLRAKLGAQDVIQKLAEESVRSSRKERSGRYRRSSNRTDMVAFDYWMKLLTSTHVDAFS